MTGALQILNHGWAHYAAIVQIAMILGFVTPLHRGFPEIFGYDEIYAFVSAYTLLSYDAREPAR